jgi:hypothetical protein
MPGPVRIKLSRLRYADVCETEVMT